MTSLKVLNQILGKQPLGTPLLGIEKFLKTAGLTSLFSSLVSIAVLISFTGATVQAADTSAQGVPSTTGSMDTSSTLNSQPSEAPEGDSYPPAQTKSETAPVDLNSIVSANWMLPFPDGKFHAEAVLTRAELASVLVNAFDLSKRNVVRESDFKIPDVPQNFWAYNAIQKALKTNTMKEYHSDEKFYPNQKIDRAEGFAILAQAYGVYQFEKNTQKEVMDHYSDAKLIPAWAHKAMATALHEGFVNTEKKGSALLIKPTAPFTRGDLAYALSQYMSRKNETSSPWTK
ncbi:MAG: S-layer homology domain-containing protein [Cyanobacteria bacterium]|nr:S-layer homology domain-containing protein [Cyanobacteriota bacterium]